MKRSLFTLLCTGALFASCHQQRSQVFLDEGNGAVEISRIDPTDWYVGLKDPSLQLMVYGPGIREAEVYVDGARVDSIVRLDSPNYLLVYLNLQGAKAGELPIAFCRPNSEDKTIVKYQLKQREMAGNERQGFTNADVLYMLMPDRFAQGPNHPEQIPGLNTYVEDRTQPSLRHGGDLEGIRQHLDYFTELGVTALWFTPVLENNSPDDHDFSTYHGYATTDYYRVDPRFGTNEQYRQLIDDAHAHGLKVVMDMIFNHCGFEHPWVSDLPSKDWVNKSEWLADHDRRDEQGEVHTTEGFLQTSYKLTPVLDPYASEVDLSESVDGWFVPTMPDLNHRNPHVMNYLIQNSIWWIETAGIDGIRMDTYPYADATGMARWMKRIDTEYPNFNVVGETWVTEPPYTATWQKDSRLINPEAQQFNNLPANSYLKTVMDFSFFDKLSKAKNEQTDGWWDGYNRVYNSLVYDYLYEDPQHVMAFVDNHDTDRFLGTAGGPYRVDKLKQALALLLTMPRIPQLYYGTEILMDGTKAVTDGDVRCDFPGGFPGDEHDAFTAEGRTPEQEDMFQWLSRLLHWRNGNETIIRGYTTQFTPWKGVYVVARRWHRSTVITVINGTDEPATLEVARFAELLNTEGTATSLQAIDIPTERSFDLTEDIELNPREGLVLELQ
ncbi:MAG: cyclomaltodextrinase N-terminal domain-containing protein [Bacteroidaceae bacterium]|nr:cyclomaltodextrinase N-terminal domain-containing protein [Bacteroidaceae bacterium]